jgi:multidrug resistance efflux pump
LIWEIDLLKIIFMPQANFDADGLISDDIQEVISSRPHWIVRKGNAILLAIVVSLLVLTWLIKYPDTIIATAKVVTSNPPKLVASRVDGKLTKLFVANEEDVFPGKHLGYIESTTNYNEVMQLQQWIQQIIDSVGANNYKVLESSQVPVLHNLGEIQSSYQAFQVELEEARQTLLNGYYERTKSTIVKDLQYLSTLKSNIQQQQALAENDQRLQKEEFEAYGKLEKDKVIAPLELNQYKSKLIAKDQLLKQINAQLTTAHANSNSKEKELLDLEKAVSTQRQRFYSAALELKSNLEKWIQQYVLTVPEAGKVLFAGSLRENQLVANGQPLFYIQPQTTQYYAEVTSSQRGLGKVKKGQRVLLDLESYPSSEFGNLQGRVNYISFIPNRRDSFLIKVDLPNGLLTSYSNSINFRNDLTARAEIITDDRRLFNRLLGQLQQAWK